MKSYCLKCRKDTENINPKVSKTSNNRTMVLSNCKIYGSKKSRFIKNQEEKGLSTNIRWYFTLNVYAKLSKWMK